MGLPELHEALRTLNQLKETGVIEDYAIGGGYAVIYHAIPYSTSDLDIFVTLRDEDDFHTLNHYYNEEGKLHARFKRVLAEA